MSQYCVRTTHRFNSDVVTMSKESNNRDIYRKAEHKQFQSGGHNTRNDKVLNHHYHERKHVKGGGEGNQSCLRNTGKYNSDNERNRRPSSSSNSYEKPRVKELHHHLQPSGSTSRRQNPVEPSGKPSTEFRSTSLNSPQRMKKEGFSHQNHSSSAAPRLVSKKKR